MKWGRRDGGKDEVRTASALGDISDPGPDYERARQEEQARMDKERARHAGRSLARLREEQGVSQAQVAAFLGRSPREVADFERGKFSGKLPDLRDIVSAYEKAIVAASRQRLPRRHENLPNSRSRAA